MNLRPEEVTALIKQQIANYEKKLELSENDRFYIEK